MNIVEVVCGVKGCVFKVLVDEWVVELVLIVVVLVVVVVDVFVVLVVENVGVEVVLEL